MATDLKWGRKSLEILSMADDRLVKVFDPVLGYGLIDIKAIESARSEFRQNQLYAQKKSRLMYPHSKHNVVPGVCDKSLALDVAPYVNLEVSYNWHHCVYLAGIVMAASKELGIKIRWGGNWDQDREPVTDQEFQDLVHYEIA